MHLLDPVQGSVRIDAPETLTVSWDTPQQITDQGVTGYQIAVTSQCFTNDEPTPPQVFNIQPSDDDSQQVTGLRECLINHTEVTLICSTYLVI